MKKQRLWGEHVLVVMLFSILIAGMSEAGTNSPVIVRINNPSPVADDLFGMAVDQLEDINGDGFEDLAIGAPGADKVYLISGASPYGVIRTISDPEGLSGYWFGYAVRGIGDVDSDGVQDIAVGAPTELRVIYPAPPPPIPPAPGDDYQPPPVSPSAFAYLGRVFILSGSTGAVIRRIGNTSSNEQFPKRYFGWAISPLGDLDEPPDGIPDLAISAPLLGAGPRPGQGSVYAVSGSDGLVMWEREEPVGQELASFGIYMDEIVDLSPFGRRELLVAAPFHDYNPDSEEELLGGRAYVLDGWNGGIVRTHSNPTPINNDIFGAGPGAIGDQTGDGEEDYAFGEAGAYTARLYNGKTGSFLTGIVSPAAGGDDYFGFGVEGTDDKDADGWNDFWISALTAGKLYLVNKSGNVLAQVNDPAPTLPGDFGWSLSTTVDLDNDGGLDLIVGKPRESAGSVANAGAAFLVLGVTPSPDEYDDETPSGEARNDSFTDAALLPGTLEANNLLMMGQVLNLNHDTSNDTDYFTVQLAPASDTYGNPECCTQTGSDMTQGRFRIEVTPERMRPFLITVYNANGTPYDWTSGLSYELDCPHVKYPDGSITFSVRDPAGRNSYDLALGYNRCYTRIYPDWFLTSEPPLYRSDIPPWPDNLPFMFPRDPDIIGGFFNGDITGPLPSEYLVFDWPRLGDYALDVTFPRGGDLSVMLLNAEAEVLAEAAWMSPYKRLAVTDLPPGLYFLVVDGGPFGTSYIIDSPVDMQAVSFDVKPTSCPNILNLKSRGKLPAAILGTEDFDVTTLDPNTLELSRESSPGGVTPIRWSYEDVATPFKGGVGDCHDLNGDGYLDLTLKFLTPALVQELELQKVIGGTTTLIITGNLRTEEGARPVVGRDCVLAF